MYSPDDGSACLFPWKLTPSFCSDLPPSSFLHSRRVFLSTLLLVVCFSFPPFPPLPSLSCINFHLGPPDEAGAVSQLHNQCLKGEPEGDSRPASAQTNKPNERDRNFTQCHIVSLNQIESDSQSTDNKMARNLIKMV